MKKSFEEVTYRTVTVCMIMMIVVVAITCIESRYLKQNEYVFDSSMLPTTLNFQSLMPTEIRYDIISE